MTQWYMCGSPSAKELKKLYCCYGNQQCHQWQQSLHYDNWTFFIQLFEILGCSGLHLYIIDCNFFSQIFLSWIRLNMIWALKHLKPSSLTIQLFVQWLIQANNKENFKAPHYWHFVIRFAYDYIMTWQMLKALLAICEGSPLATSGFPSQQSGTKPNLVAKILATNFGVFFVI